MKTLAICLLVIALATIVVPAGHAAPRCISFTNFCDRIEYDTTHADNVAGIALWGSWDWLCTGEGTSVIGGGGQRLVAATRPADAGSGYVFAYSMAFYFRKSSHLFDLAATAGLDSGILFFQTNQPWTQTSGSCGFLKRDKSKPRLLAAQ